MKLLRLTMQEVGELVFGPTTPMKDVHASIAPYVVEWDFKAENLLTGELIDVPPPAEIGGEVFEIMEGPIGTMIVLWLKSPQFMERGDDEKKDSSSSEPTEPPSSESD